MINQRVQPVRHIGVKLSGTISTRDEGSHTMKLSQLNFERLLTSFERRYKRFVQQRFQRLVAKNSPLGFRFLGNDAMQAGAFEPEETRLIKHLTEHVDYFINIGANIGYYCCIALQKGLPVIAYEPEQSNLKYLLRNVRENGWGDRIEILPIALSEKPGIVEIYGSGTGASLLKGWANTPDHLVDIIPASTLDLSLGQRLRGSRALILIDIEGAEYSAIQGGLITLRQDPKPIWIVEICSHQHQPIGVTINPRLLDTFELFWNAGYYSYTVERKTRLIEKSEIDAIQQGGVDTLGVHNFIFIHSTLDSNVYLSSL